MKYKGGIFKLPFPFTDLTGQKARPALAITDPDEWGDIEFVFITTKQSRSFGKTIELTEDAFETKKLPFPSILHLDKKYLLSRDIIIKEITTVTKTFLEKVLREQALLASKKHYEVKHKDDNNLFLPGDRIPYAGRVFDEKEITALVDSSLDFWLTTGRYAAQFERELSKFLSVRHCSLTNSGSSANLLAFMALTSPELGDRRIKKADEVITVAAGFPTTVAPIIQYGAVPVFIDVSLPTYNIDCTQLEEALSDKTKAIMIAHTLGNPFDLGATKDFCDKHNLWLIEDNCDALGSRYLYNGEWKYTGTIGHIGTSSFYPPHHITMGEGGAIYTNDPQLKRLVESFRDWGRDCWCPSGRDNTCGKRFSQKFGDIPFGYDHKYVYIHFGYNLKVTDMQAAIGCAQLEKLPDFIEARKRNWKLLRNGLTDLSDIFILPEATKNSDPSWFGFPISVRKDAPFSRHQIVGYLEDKKIATRLLFGGNLIHQPAYKDVKYRMVGELKNSDFVMNQLFWVGVYPGLSKKAVEYVVDALHKFCQRLKP